jgi:predicted MFS family arabinose efflux permease
MAVWAWGTVFYGYSFYVDSLTEAGRFTVTQLSIGIALSFWAGVPAGIMVGRWMSRHPPSLAVAYGVVSIAAALLILPRTDNIWIAYCAFVLFGTGYPCLSTSGITGALNYYVHTRYASRLSIALTGASVGGAIMIPLMVALRTQFGFADAMSIVASVMVVVLLPPILTLLRREGGARVDTAGSSPSTDTKSILASREFLLIALGTGAALGAQVGYLTHQVPLLSQHLSTEEAAIGVAITAGMGIPGRFLAGWLAERMDVAVLALGAPLVQAVGLVLLMGSQAWPGLYAGCALTGFVVGAVVMLPALLVRDRFGAERYSMVYGYANVGLYAGAGLGPLAVGLARAHTGDYALGIAGLIAVHIAAAAVLFALRRR